MRTVYRIVIILLVVLSIQALAAQTDSTQTVSKNKYLPEKGNFAIGADATPLFNFVGNMFNGNLDNQFDMRSPLIYAKYYLTDNMALRTVLGVNTTTKSDLFYVQDDAARMANPLSNAQVTDKKTDNSNGYYLSLGLQKFIGEKRLRGFYGAQLFTKYGKDKATYAYGNPMTSLNPTPSSNSVYLAGERKLSEVTSHDFMLGAGGIAGFEYYIAPRLCIGGEVSLNVVYTQKFQTYQKSEKVVGGEVVNMDKALSPGGHELNFQTSSFTPNTFQHVGLYVMLHF